jgi:hypothetical protein
MDVASAGTIRFLEALQNSRERLTRILYSELIANGAKSAKVILNLSGRPFRVHEQSAIREFTGSVLLAIRATPPAGEPMDFGIDVMWGESSWIVQTEVWVDKDTGQRLVKSFPERHASTLEECLIQMEEAVSDLCGCGYILKEVIAANEA